MNGIKFYTNIIKSFIETPFSLRFIPSYKTTDGIRGASFSHCINEEGLDLEFGVYDGTSINFFARKKQAYSSKLIYGFDSFEGLPDDWKEAKIKKGEFDLKGHLPSVEQNVVLIKGLFKDTLPVFCELHKGQKVRFVHIDCDLYESTKEVFKNLRLLDLDGATILFDEFYFYNGFKKHEYRAFLEFLKMSNYKAIPLFKRRFFQQACFQLVNGRKC